MIPQEEMAAKAATLRNSTAPSMTGQLCGLTVTPSGGKSCAVVGYPLATPDAPFLVDEVNITKATTRERLVDVVPAEFRAEMATLLERAAASWAQRSVNVTDADAAGADAPALPYQPVEPADDPQDGAELFASIYDTIRRYVWVADEQTVFLSLWVLSTYALDAADHTPYAHIYAPVKQCGKSTLLDVLAGLVSKGVRVSNLSAAFLFRVLDKYAPTLLIDEVGAWLNGQNAGELRGILNDGYQRNGRVGRVESSTKGGSNEFHPTYFRVWGAKAFSGIGRDLSDELLDRCVPVRLARAGDSERAQLLKLRDRDYQQHAAPLRARCARWVADTLPTLRTSRPELPAPLSGRQQDIWEPLLAIADAISSSVGERARHASVTLHDRPTLGLGEQLLSDLLDIFVDEAPASGFLTTDELLTRLVARDDRPWCEMPGNYRPLSARGLSSQLKRFDIEHSRPRGDGKRGYQLATFLGPWRQYLSDADAKKKLSTLSIPGTSGTCGTPEPQQVPHVPTVPDTERVQKKDSSPNADSVSRTIERDGRQVRQVQRLTAHGDRWFDAVATVNH